MILTVSFQARPGKDAELKEALTEILTPTRQEDGCLFLCLIRMEPSPLQSADFLVA